MHDYESMVRRFRGLFLLFPLDDISRCKYPGMPNDLERGRHLDRSRRVKNVPE